VDGVADVAVVFFGFVVSASPPIVSTATDDHNAASSAIVCAASTSIRVSTSTKSILVATAVD